MSNESVFEALDVTGDEYRTLGLWPTLDAALAELEDCDDPAELDSYESHDLEDVCVVEVCERRWGWGDIGTKRAAVLWRREYRDDDDDEGTWTRKTERKE